MSTRLLSRLLWRIYSSKQAIPAVVTCASHLQTRYVADLSEIPQPVFPAVKRIPVRFSAEIENVMASNWDKIEKYASVLNCKTKTVETLVRGDTRIVTNFNPDTVCRKMELLTKYRYDPEEIAMFPPIFCMKYAEIENRLIEMESIRSYNSSLYLVWIAKRKFRKKIAEYKNEMKLLGDHRSKMHFVASKLDCHVNDIYDMVNKGHTHLMTRPPSAINTLVDLIKEHGYTTEDIKKFPIVLIFKISEAKKRFELVKQCGILGKTSLASVLVTNKGQFRATLQYWTTELAYLEGLKDCKDILKTRLGVSDSELESMYRRTTMLKCLRAKKLQSCLDILLKDMQIDPSSIVQKPSVLYYSPLRLEKRHRILQAAGIEDSRQKVNELCLTETAFANKYLHLMIELGMKLS